MRPGISSNIFVQACKLEEKKKKGRETNLLVNALAFALVLSTWVGEISLSLSAHLGEVGALFGYFHLSMRSECLLAWETRSTGDTFEICHSNTPPLRSRKRIIATVPNNVNVCV